MEENNSTNIEASGEEIVKEIESQEAELRKIFEVLKKLPRNVRNKTLKEADRKSEAIAKARRIAAVAGKTITMSDRAYEINKNGSYTRQGKRLIGRQDKGKTERY